jgi:hypothetical protein
VYDVIFKNIHNGEDKMMQEKRWEMYYRIQELKRMGLNKSQIARHAGLDRRTVSWYYNTTPDEVHARNEELKTRYKRLDKYKSIILDWLKEFPDSSSSQIHDWLKERYSKLEIAVDVGRSSQTTCPWLPLVRYTFNMLVPPIVFFESLKKGIKKQAYLRCENTPVHFIENSYSVAYEGSDISRISQKAEFIPDFEI